MTDMPSLPELVTSTEQLCREYTRTKQRERILVEQNARYRQALLQIANSTGQFRLSMIAYEALNGPRGEG